MRAVARDGGVGPARRQGGDDLVRQRRGLRAIALERYPPDADTPFLGIGVLYEGHRAHRSVGLPHARDCDREGLPDLDVITDAVGVEEGDLPLHAQVAVRGEKNGDAADERHTELRNKVHGGLASGITPFEAILRGATRAAEDGEWPAVLVTREA